jgi:hypothetical protein
MLADEDILIIARFFYLSVQGEGLAYRLCYETVNKLNKTITHNTKLNDKQILIVSACNKKWLKLNKKNNQYSPLMRSRWVLPDNLNTSVWRQFQKNVEPDWLIIFIFNHVLNFELTNISEGLNVSVGTIKYRSNKALRVLSYYNSFGEFEL